MPAKSDSAPTPAAAAPAPAGEAAGAAPAARGVAGLLSALWPIVIVVVVAPVLTWTVAELFLMPRLEKRLAGAVSGVDASAKLPASGDNPAEPKKGEPGAPTNTYEFKDIVVNLSGTMGTRYLKTSFLVTGTDTTLHGTFETNKAKLVDVTLNVLSALSLAELDEAGAKNVIREKLVIAYNQALGKHIAEQVYFSDFVVQ